MRALILAAVLAAVPATAAAQTPDSYGLGAAAAEYGASPGCMAAVVDVETGGTWDPAATNPRSGAHGLSQLLPAGGVFSESPWARLGLTVWDLSPFQQLEVLSWGLASGYKSAWAASLPGGC